MADQDLDDFDFDEHGIYRDKASHGSGDQGIMLDDDGIWRDDTDHWSHNTYRTYDSGIAFTDRRRQLPVTTDIDGYYSRHGSSYTTDSLPPDEKSLNISELEATESVVGDEISFGHRSYHSDENLDFPELQDSSYQLDSARSSKGHRTGVGGSITDYSDLDDIKGYQHYHGKSYRRHNYSDDDESGVVDYAKIIPGTHDDDILDSRWGASGYESTVLERMTVPSSSAVERTTEIGQPRILGDSLFTQEDMPQVTGGQSLVEFEQLEAEVGGNNGGDPQGDNMDLIGVYLKGLAAQEQEEDEAQRGIHDDQEMYMDHGYPENGEVPHVESPRPSQIPMLRNRSPSMSRPSSSSPTRGRTRSVSPGFHQSMLSPRKDGSTFSLPAPRDEASPSPPSRELRKHAISTPHLRASGTPKKKKVPTATLR